MKRPLTPEEVARISRERPWFGRARRVADRDIETAEAEVLTFSVRRLWDVNECGPACCPRAVLVETESGEYIHLESWTTLPELASIAVHCEAHRTIHGKTLVAFHTSGPRVRAENVSVREALSDLEAAECEQIELEALPQAFRQMVARWPKREART